MSDAPSIPARDLHRVVHKELRQIVANDLGVHHSQIKSEVRGRVQEVVDKAITDWFQRNGIKTVDDLVTRAIDKHLAGWRSGGTALQKLIEQAATREVGRFIASSININITSKE